MKRLFTSAFIALITLTGASAHTPISLSLTETVAPDSADIAYYGKKHFLRAAGTVFGLNIGVWAADRYIKNADYAHLSLHTIADNFRNPLVWDNDNLITNMFAHPYHGNLYFNAGRSNGFNYWQSGLFALGGSAMWEYFMENEYPSANDLICTPIGGMALGEIAYRGSDMVLDDRATGWERFGREAAAFIISPMRGFTRIITGDAWRHRDTSGRQFGSPNLSAEMSLGVRALELESPIIDNGIGVASEIHLEYGDRFEIESPKPYDYFTIRVDLNIHNSQPFLSQVNIKGRLLGKEWIDTHNRSLSVGLYQHYDFYDSDTISTKSAKAPYRLGVPASIGGGLMYRHSDDCPLAFDAYAHANAVILGGVLSDYYSVHNRDYNLASGFSLKGGFDVIYGGDKFSLATKVSWFRLFTVKGYHEGTNLSEADFRTINVQGDRSVTSFVVAEARADYKLASHIYATGTFSLYHRSTHYALDLDPVKSTSCALKLMLTYKF